MTFTDVRLQNRILLAIRIFVIALSALLVALITYDSVTNISFLTSTFYLRAQFWICLLFIVSIVAEMVVQPRRQKARVWVGDVLFLLLCIPYTNIIVTLDLNVSPKLQYIIRLIPMLRAGYALAIVSGTMTKSWLKGLFFSYMMILVFSLYFGSLMFYIEEHVVNSAVTDYWTALYWTWMDITTCGSAINAVTPTGKVIAVLLAGEGLMLFPVFTVYVTDAVTHSDG